MSIKHLAVCTECDYTGEPKLMNAAARDAGEHRDESGHAVKVERATVTDGGRDQSVDEIDRVIIAQCTGSKRDGKHAARDLYDESLYFQRQREYAEAVADEWFIQSALYGLLHPDDVVESYDRHAKDVDDAEAWATGIADDLADAVPDSAVVEVLGGKRYTDPLTPELEARGFEVHEPLRGQRIGKRRQSLAKMANTKLEEFA